MRDTNPNLLSKAKQIIRQAYFQIKIMTSEGMPWPLCPICWPSGADACPLWMMLAKMDHWSDPAEDLHVEKEHGDIKKDLGHCMQSPFCLFKVPSLSIFPQQCYSVAKPHWLQSIMPPCSWSSSLSEEITKGNGGKYTTISELHTVKAIPNINQCSGIVST